MCRYEGIPVLCFFDLGVRRTPVPMCAGHEILLYLSTSKKKAESVCVCVCVLDPESSCGKDSIDVGPRSVHMYGRPRGKRVPIGGCVRLLSQLDKALMGFEIKNSSKESLSLV